MCCVVQISCTTARSWTGRHVYGLSHVYWMVIPSDPCHDLDVTLGHRRSGSLSFALSLCPLLMPCAALPCCALSPCGPAPARSTDLLEPDCLTRTEDGVRSERAPTEEPPPLSQTRSAGLLCHNPPSNALSSETSKSGPFDHHTAAPAVTDRASARSAAQDATRPIFAIFAVQGAPPLTG